MMLSEDDRALSVAAQAKPVGDILGSAPEPGTFSGVLGEIPRGAVRGLAAAQGLGASVAESVTQPVYNALTAATGIPTDNPFGQLRRASDETVRAFAPDPLTVGAAGQIVNGVATITSELAAGAALTAATGGTALPNLMWGAAGFGGAATGRTTYNELLEKGVDPSTAVNAGFIDAVTTGGGALLPAGVGFSGLGETLAAGGLRLSRPAFVGANAAFGAAVNTATGVIQRGATQDALSAGGYDAMARQYAPMDGAAMTADALLGGIFSTAGSVAALPARASHTVDAALAARDAKHAGITTAPGIPSDPNAAAAHGRALDKALRDVWDGNSVDVGGTGVADQAFVFGQRDTSAAAAAAREYGMPAAQVQPSTRLADIPPPDRSALPYNAPELNEYAAHVEQQYGLPSGLINALKNAGERSNGNQVSPAGARGVMQFMPENLKKYGVTDPTDPVQMIDAAGRYLADTARQYGGNVDAMIADYNGGPRQARRVLNGELPSAPDTRDYLARVKGELGEGVRSAPPEPEQSFAQRLGREAPRDEAGAPTFADGTAYGHDAIEPFFDQFAAGRPKGEPVPDVLFQVGRMDDQTAAGLAGVLPGFNDSMREVRISGQSIKHIDESRPAIARDVLTRLEDNALYADEVLPNPKNPDRALVVLRDTGKPNERGVTVLEVAADQQGVSVVSSMTAPERSLRKARELKAEMGKARPEGQQLSAEAPNSPHPRLPEQVPAHAAADFPTVDQAGPSVPQASEGASGGAAPEQRPGGAAGQDLGAADDIETRAGLALLDDVGDIKIQTVDENGQPMELSLRDALADANAELEYATPEAFDAAIMCQLRGGA